MPALSRARVFAPVLFLISVFYWSVLALKTTFNSGDLMSLESLYHPLFVLHLPLREFVFTEAFFFFPDGLIYFPLRFVLGHQPLATGAMMVLTTAVGLWLAAICYRRVRGRNVALEMASAAALFTILLSFSGRMLHLIFWPNHHSLLLICAVGFYLYVVDFSGRWTFTRVLALFTITTLLLFSDGNAALEIVLPLILFYLFFERDRRSLFPVATLFASVAAAGFALYICKTRGILIFHSANLIPEKKQWLENLATTPEAIATLNRESWLYQFALLSILIVTRGLRTRGSAFREIDRFFALGVGASLLVVISLGRLNSVYSVRYLEIVFFFFSLWIALASLPRLFAHALFRRHFPRILLAYLTLMSAIYLLLPRHDFTDTKLQDCVRENLEPLHVRKGLGAFWGAKLLTFTSPFAIDQVDENFHRFLWMNGEKWFAGEHDYFLADTNDLATKASLRYGLPSKTFACPGSDYKILYYRSGLPAPGPDPEDELDSANAKK